MRFQSTLAILATAAVGAAVASAVVAQDNGITFPNPLRNENLAATCANMSAEIRAADPQAMAVLVGTWSGQSVIPGTPGLVPDTPANIQVVNNADGTFTTDFYACFQPFGMAQSCAQSTRYGEWTAHFDPSGWIAAPFLSAGSGFTGEVLPVSCAINYWRALDADTLVDQGGQRLTRAAG